MAMAIELGADFERELQEAGRWLKGRSAAEMLGSRPVVDEIDEITIPREN